MVCCGGAPVLLPWPCHPLTVARNSRDSYQQKQQEEQEEQQRLADSNALNEATLPPERSMVHMQAPQVASRPYPGG